MADPELLMDEHFPPAPSGIDMHTPSVARMYDFLLGGKDNFAVDRESAEVLLEHVPEIPSLAQDNRAFLARAVDHVARQGVLQYLDLGAGLPTADNTHDIAQRADERARVVYVDNDPVVLAHGRALLAGRGGTAFADHDLRDAEGALDTPEAKGLLIPGEPVCLMLVSVLHCLPDTESPFEMVRKVMRRLAPGSYLIYSHIVSDDPETADWLTGKMHGFGTPWGRVRSPQEASAAFEGLTPVSAWTDGREGGPRVVDCASWRHPDLPPRTRPDEGRAKVWELSGVAVKP